MYAYQPRNPDVGGHGEGPSTVRGTAPIPTVERHRAQWPSGIDLRSELLRAELAGELSEFNALSFQAVLAMIESADAADDYLEMAEAVAGTEHEFAIVAGIRATYDRVQRSIVSRHSKAGADEGAELWQSLLIALAQLAPHPIGIPRTK